MNRRRIPSRRNWPDNLYCDDGYYSFRNPLTGKKKGLGRDKAQAFSEARAANKAIASMSQHSLAQWVVNGDAMNLVQWLPIYEQMWIEKRSPAASTLDAARRYFKRFAQTDFATLPLEQVTTLHVAKYLDAIEQESGSGAAVNIRARLLDVFGYAITKGHLERNPVEATIPAKFETARDRLSLEQFINIREEAGPALANAMNLALLTAQRVSDVSEMKFSDVRREDGREYLLVTQAKLQGKMRQKIDTRIHLGAVGMSIADAVKLCRDRIVSQYMIHQTRTTGGYKAGEKMSSAGISRAFSDARDRAAVKPAAGKEPTTFHEIRSLSIRLYTQQYGKEFAQALAGHKTEVMTAEYADLRGSAWQVISAGD